MSNKPTYIAYIVDEPKDEGGKSFWREVGSVWPHKNGEGFDVMIPAGLSISGRIVCVPRKEKQPTPPAE